MDNYKELYTLSNISIVQGGYSYYVPCPLVPYISEINALLSRYTIRAAFLKVALDHNIKLLEYKNTCRRTYQQPQANPIPLSIAKSVDSFILTTGGPSNDGFVPSPYVERPGDSRFLTTFGVGASVMTYSTMQTYSLPLSKLFSSFMTTLTNVPLAYIACVCVPITVNTPSFTGIIYIGSGQKFVFLPVIHPKLLSFYDALPPGNISVYFQGLGCSIAQNSLNLLYQYTKDANATI